MKLDREKTRKLFKNIPEQNLNFVMRELERISTFRKRKIWYARPKTVDKEIVAKKATEALRAFKIKGDAPVKFFEFFPDKKFVDLIVLNVDLGSFDAWSSMQGKLVTKVEKLAKKSGRRIGDEVDHDVLDQIETMKLLEMLENLLKLSSRVNYDTAAVQQILVEIMYNTVIGEIEWNAVSDILKKNGYKENPFGPLIDIIDMGLLPLGYVKMNGQLAFWIGIPIGERGWDTWLREKIRAWRERRKTSVH